MTKEDWGETIRSEPIVTYWFPEETFEVVEPVKKVNGLELGRLIVKRTKDSQLFFVMVIPVRNIPVGSTVKIAEVHHVTMQMSFLVGR